MRASEAISYHSCVEWTLSLALGVSQPANICDRGITSVGKTIPFLSVGDLLKPAERAGVVKTGTVARDNVCGHPDPIEVDALVVPVLVPVRVRVEHLGKVLLFSSTCPEA